MSEQMQRSRGMLLRLSAAGTAFGAATLAVPRLALAEAPESVQVAEIYQLQHAFHQAKTVQDLDLMMSLWAEDAVLVNQGDPKSPYAGAEAIRLFFAGSGSFAHRRLSLVPSFKIQVDVHGDQAWLYFECHDVGDYDLSTRFIAADLFLAGTVRDVGGNWLFWRMTAGKSFPLSADRYYFP